MKRSAVRNGMILLMLMLSACGWFGGDKKKIAPLVEFKPSVQSKTAWRNSLPTSRTAQLRPSILNGRVYAASQKGEVAAFDTATGRQFWRVTVKETLTSGVGVGDGLVVVGTQKGVLIAFGEDGRERWRSTVTGEVLGPARIAPGGVVARTVDGNLIGLNVADGKRLWMSPRSNPPLILRSAGSVSVQEGIVYAGHPAGKLSATRPDNGALVWESTLSAPRGATELERVTDVASDPWVDSQQVCAAAFQGKIGCYGVAKGNLQWARELSSSQALNADQDNLYAVDEKGTVYALERVSGNEVWKQTKLEGRRVTGAAVVGNQVIVGDFEGYLHVLSAQDGGFIGRAATDGGAIVGAPLATDSGVIAQTAKGGLFHVVLQ